MPKDLKLILTKKSKPKPIFIAWLKIKNHFYGIPRKNQP
jgi:hypothetical protein